jgi:hypothetical protein
MVNSFHAPPKIRNLLLIRKSSIYFPDDDQHKHVRKNSARERQHKEYCRNRRNMNHLQTIPELPKLANRWGCVPTLMPVVGIPTTGILS